MPDKTFLQQHPAGSCANHRGKTCKPAGAGWRWGRGGAPYVLYRLPEILAAAMVALVFLVEGERCADALATLGLVATTCPEGAGSWRSEYTETLRDRRVVILPDNDHPGAAHADDIIQDLLGVAAELRSIVLPGLPYKGDVVDWLAAGGTQEALLRMADAAPILRSPSATFPKAVDTRVLDLTAVAV